MIRKAVEADKQSVYRIWKEMFAHDDNGYTDFYFKHKYETKNTWVIEENSRIIATMQINPHVIVMGGKKIQTSLILGVATIPSEQKKGHMRAMMEEALNRAESREMITLIQAYNPAIYKQFGFAMQYMRQSITYQSSQIPRYANLKISEFFDTKQLVEVYEMFTSRFDGYFVRDEQYYQKYVMEIASEGGKIAVYRNQDNVIEGYMVYHNAPELCEIRELIYLNSWALLGLLGYAAKMRPSLDVHVSGSEQIQKLIPGGKTKSIPFMMARINDIPLFNMCYNTAIHNVDEADRKSVV